MTVLKLIEFLKTCNQDYEVKMIDGESGKLTDLYFGEKNNYSIVLADADNNFVYRAMNDGDRII